MRKNRTNKSGEAPLYIRIIKNRRSRYISLNFRLPPKFWNQDEQKIKSSYPNSTRFNSWLKTKVSETLKDAVELQDFDVDYKTKDVKAKILGSASPVFLEYARKYIKQAYLDKGKEPTYERYCGTLNKLEAYLTKMGNPHFTLIDMDVKFLKDFENWLIVERGNKKNTIGKDLKSFRRILNEAVMDQLLPHEKNPFLRFKLTWESVEKCFLSEHELTAIEEYDIDPKLSRSLHRDIFVFSCYAGGLRISDICTLKWIHFDGSNINMTAQKNKRRVSIRLPKKALAILDKYRMEGQKPGDYIFPILDRGDDIKRGNRLFKKINSKNVLVNNSLAIIVEDIGIEKHITFHTSRHTFATRALSKGMKIHHVSKLLGHASVKTTEVYAKIVDKDLDDAMGVFDEEE